jgi:para-aminobenzoate synthetase component 1
MGVAAIDGFIEQMNSYGADGIPFLFIIDFDMVRPEIYKLDSVPGDIKFSTPLFSNFTSPQIYSNKILLVKYPVTFEKYKTAFENVQKNINLGNTYLLNLTFPTEIKTEPSLEEIFYSCVARYKLYYQNTFIVFSPEIFVRISDGKIKSFPMKGTIDASFPDAENVLLNDPKEEAEHNTIVDLIRNDLSRIASKVSVTRYRYIDHIITGSSELLQVSSEITGTLNRGYRKYLGDIICGLLPAGSVTGAPKKETLRIIRESENYDRGWYTGVFGVFDGTSLDSGVMIRFIEKNGDELLFKSGGGITYLSDPVKEYDELISKVYVPAG